VNDELDNMKRTYNGIEDLMGTVARHIAQRVPIDLPNEFSVIFFPQIGFLIAMPMDAESGRVPYEGGIADPWERMFNTEYA